METLSKTLAQLEEVIKTNDEQKAVKILNELKKGIATKLNDENIQEKTWTWFYINRTYDRYCYYWNLGSYCCSKL